MYLAYSVLTLAAFILVSPYFLYQAIRYKKYVGSLRERLGYLPISFNVDGEESIWIHAVSVGEALTARALAADLKRRYPRLRLYLSTTTMAGQQVARSSLHHLVDGVFYFPFDWMFTIRRTLNLVRPRLFIMLETEIWPNLLHACRKRNVRTAVINGRISARSYPRYKLIRPFFRRVLADVDRFCMQSEESAHRLKDLGADPGRVSVTGSLKFDSLELPSQAHGKSRERVLRFFRVSSRRTVLVAGSTMRGEETAVLQAFRKIKTTQTHAVAIIAPRQPERFGEVERLAREAGFVTIRRSELPIDAEPRADVVVLDTIGELAQLYQLATAVFVGGSLADHGGHNILEPAIFGKPIVFGPHMQNFREIAETFVANDAAIQVQSERELDAAMLSLVRDPVRRASLGAAARALVEANRGAKDKTLAVLADLLPPAGSGGVVRPFRLVH
jgi:3-deoxy-D-manno-octulosonic-acid transferase